MKNQIVKTKCTSCGHEKQYPFDDFAGPEKETCFICSGTLEVLNLEELKRAHLIDSLKKPLQEQFQMVGIERAIEIIETMSDQDAREAYIEALHKHFPQLKVRDNAE